MDNADYGKNGIEDDVYGTDHNVTTCHPVLRCDKLVSGLVPGALALTGVAVSIHQTDQPHRQTQDASSWTVTWLHPPG